MFSIKDEDPYVRKTAAVCVAKLYDINNQMVEDQGFLDALKDLLSDSNPMVSTLPIYSIRAINEAMSLGSRFCPLCNVQQQRIHSDDSYNLLYLVM